MTYIVFSIIIPLCIGAYITYGTVKRGGSIKMGLALTVLFTLAYVGLKSIIISVL